MKSKTDILDIFSAAKNNHRFLKVCAPMVRYSKVQFRSLVKNYGVDLCFTPMILADSFCQNAKARTSEFSTTVSDTPLIAQFAANSVDNFVDASMLVFPYVDGVDLNCGCPQRWAMQDGYGSALLSKPELIKDLVKGVRASLPTSFSVSVKIRILKDLKNTIEMCRQLEMCGVSFLTVHGRTPSQKSTGAVDKIALKEVHDSVRIPIIANGGIRTLSDAEEMYKTTQCEGVMAASAMLTNPALFSGTNRTPLSCVRLWMNLKNHSKDWITFQNYHHHLVFMLDKILTKQEKQDFNLLNTFENVDDFIHKIVLSSYDDEVEQKYDLGQYIDCEFSNEITLKHSKKCRGCAKSMHYCTCKKYDSSATDGNFFVSYVKDTDGVDYMDSNIFDEVI